jgi:hypothetical protein
MPRNYLHLSNSHEFITDNIGSEVSDVAMGIGAWVETWLDKRRNEALEKRDRELKEAERNKFNEENVRKIQLEFECRLEETIYWREAYIYRHLMSKWFSSLIEKYRYDKSMSNKIRSDWLSYMSLLKQAGSLRFLSLHSSNEDKRNSYKQRELEERKTYMAIEEAFAAQISKKAVETLQRVRESEHDAFDRSGKEIIAPNGYHYFCVSFDPYKEELRPREFTASPPTPK